MVAFHNSNELKDRCLDIVYRDRWDKKVIVNLIKANNTSFNLSDQYGIPKSLNMLAKNIWLHLPKIDQANFNVSYLEKIKVGQNLNNIYFKFIWALLSGNRFPFRPSVDAPGLITLEYRQKIKLAMVEVSCSIFQTTENDVKCMGELLPALKYLQTFNDPMCKAVVTAFYMLDHWDYEKDDFDYHPRLAELCEEFIDYVNIIWQEFEIKDRGILLRDILFKCIAEEAQLPTV